MKKRPLLVFLLILIFGCTAPQEQTSLEVPASDIEETVVIDEMPITREEPAKEMIVADEQEQVKPVAGIPKIGCTREFSPKFSSSPHYQGPLFDAHFHMPNLIDLNEIKSGEGQAHEMDSGKDPLLGKNVELSKLLCFFDKENVVGVIGFAIGAEEAVDETISKAKSIRDESSGRIKLFLMPGLFNTESLEEIGLSDNGLFKGYGEIGFYVFPYANTPPDSPEMMKLYAVAGKHGLVIMMHPNARQESQVENALQKNPDVKFLIHGPEIENSIASIIEKYQNAFYSIDAILIRKPGSPGGLIYTTNSVEELRSSFNQNYDRMMNEAVSRWKSKIEKYPDRFMWGTDRAYLWHYDEEVSVLLEEFGRDFIAELDPAVQEKFAYENAEKLFRS